MQGRIQEFLPISQGISGRLHNLGPIRSCLEQLLLPPFGSPEHVGPVLTFRADRRNADQLKQFVQEALFVRFNISLQIFHSIFIKKSILTAIHTVGTGSQPHTTLVFQNVDQTSHHSLPIGRILTKDRKSTRLNSSHVRISYAVFCLKKKKQTVRTLEG